MEQEIVRGIEWSLRAFVSMRAVHAFIFASPSGDQICLANSEHFRKHLMTSSEHFVNLKHTQLDTNTRNR